jgi:hypothetical protein
MNKNEFDYFYQEGAWVWQLQSRSSTICFCLYSTWRMISALPDVAGLGKTSSHLWILISKLRFSLQEQLDQARLSTK